MEKKTSNLSLDLENKIWEHKKLIEENNEIFENQIKKFRENERNNLNE